MFDFLDKTGIKFLLEFVKSKLSGKSDSGHTHSKADITDFPDSLPANGGNADTVDGLHANEIASNPNLLINPDFRINQRGLTGWLVVYDDSGVPITATQEYIMDRWRIMDGTINITNGIITLTGTIIQVLENGIGTNFTATVSVASGTATASYDDTTRTFTIIGNRAVLNWAKLEYGNVATPFIPPDPATELMKCRRYYRTINRGTTAYAVNATSVVFALPFDTPMRNVTPSMQILNTASLCWSGGWLQTPEKSALSIISVNGNYLGICYIHVSGFDVTINGTAFDGNYSFRLGSDNFIGIDAEIY